MQKGRAPVSDSGPMAAQGNIPKVVLKLTADSTDSFKSPVKSSEAQSSPPVAAVSLLQEDVKRSPPAATSSPTSGSPSVGTPANNPEELAAAAALAEATAALGVDVPAGSGPLYKCAICGALVYESQLDHHVIICPDPDEHGPEGITEGIAEEDDEELEEAEAEDNLGPLGGARTQGEVSAELNDSGSAMEKLSWKQQKETNLAQHHANQTERVGAKRQQIVDEMRKKEAEECTFAPKILPRGNPRTCTRAQDGSGDTNKWSQRWEQRARGQRLKQVEAQVYADVTLKPKISPFAQAWSQKQQEVTPDGQPHQTVFERLYTAALQATDARTRREALQDMADEAITLRANDTNPGSSPGGPGNGQVAVSNRHAQPPRRIPTSELLYSDALDRRERLKTLAEHVHMNSEEAVRDKSQVLSRSRRYYWQMLERQIKAAFDEATAGQPLLQFAVLQDFLVRFGCMRTPQQESSKTPSSERAAAVQSADDESKKLRAALWKHLDPAKAGAIDLLTLTVFFHVLMGAVDDAAKASASQNLRPEGAQAQGGQEESPGSPRGSPVRSPGVSVSPRSDVTPSTPIGALDPAGCTSYDGADTNGPSASPEGVPSSTTPNPSPVRSGSGGSMLAAIFEEGDPQAGNLAANLGGELNTTLGDDEGRRICELLVRFDPIRLRTEFQQLYLHRLHYQPHQSSPDSRFEEIAAPEIDAQSRAMAEKVIERQRGESGGTLSQHADLLLWRHSQVEAKKEERRVAAKAEEVSGCTFRPKMTAKPRDMPLEMTPRGSSRNEALYARAIADKERKEARAQETAKAQKKQETQGCTFKPDTGKSAGSYQRGNDGSAPVPRGFYENRQRMRAANEVLSQKRHQREDRLCKIDKLGGNNLNASTASSIPPPSLGEQLLQPLPVVAEDSRLQEQTRGPVVKNNISRGGGRSPRSQSGGRGGRGGRNAADRARTASPAGDRPDSSPNGSASASARRSPRGVASRSPEPGHGTPREGWGTGASSRAMESPGAPREGWGTPNNGVLAPSSEVSVPAQFGTPASASPAALGSAAPASQPSGSGEDSQAPPLLYVDVNIAPNQPPERIVLREGQSVTEVAAEFAAKHVLTPALAQRLHALLREVLQRQENQQQQR